MTASASFEAIGTSAVVVVSRSAALAEARALLADELDRFDRACSRFRPDSELSRANAAAGRPVTVSALLADAVRVALDAASETGGLVTPALGRNLRAAGYDRTYALVRARGTWTFSPAPAGIDAWREIRLVDDRLLVPAGMELDLGATAKALAADRAAARIAHVTGSGVVVSLGGDIAIGGEAPSGGWPVRIADDHRAPLDGPGPVVAVDKGGLATSSTATRRWRTTQGELHHVFDPRTGRPVATRWRTVSVATRSCVEANVAATAGLLLGLGASAWLTGRHLAARLVAEDGQVSQIGGWPVAAEAA